LPQKENEQKIFRRGEAEAFECVREKRLVNIGAHQRFCNSATSHIEHLIFQYQG
jgi:hypothetical protein